MFSYIQHMSTICTRNSDSRSPLPHALLVPGMCSNGVEGIESSGGGACCVLECGQCGGPDCATANLVINLGADECCETYVLANSEPCGEAPCVIGGAS